MKSLVILIFLFLSMNLWADGVKIEINPARPVAGEVFQALFRISTESSDEPTINFSPGGLEVVDKSNQGISTRTVYANGSLTVTREMLVVYELVANKPGTSFLRDITVQVGNSTLRHPMVSINVLKEPEVAADIFVMADATKTDVFVGEGITVRYYIYTKVPINNPDVKKYPKLNGFLKRFFQEPDRQERVSVKGETYIRHQIYAAKLFPEKVGDLKVDALSLSVTYPVTRGNDPFSAFGGFARDFKTATINSEPLTINVKPLPQPVPDHFTGLVGRHDFDLDLNQQKLIVNEPLEVKLTISGPGALENLEAPHFIKHPGLEEFESTGDLKINDSDLATKVFDYTFLAKENFTLPASKLTLSYLDPQSGRYVPTELNVPEITVAGGNGNVKKETPASKGETVSKNKTETKAPKELTLSGPIFNEQTSLSHYLTYLNVGLAFLAIVLSLTFFIRSKPSLQSFSRVNIPTEFKKGQFEFGDFARWISPLIRKTGKSPLLIIKDSELDEATKNYFTNVLNSLDEHQYSPSKAAKNFQYDATHFKKLAQYIESVNDESRSESA